MNSKQNMTVANAQPLNFIFSTERALPIENIDYSTKATIIIMYYTFYPYWHYCYCLFSLHIMASRENYHSE
jgi:hypothetical protein